jgi:hypothetical protein
MYMVVAMYRLLQSCPARVGQIEFGQRFRIVELEASIVPL